MSVIKGVDCNWELQNIALASSPYLLVGKRMETITGRVDDVFTHIIAIINSLFIGGGSVAERLDRWTWNLEAQCSSPALTASWICSR